MALKDWSTLLCFKEMRPCAKDTIVSGCESRPCLASDQTQALGPKCNEFCWQPVFEKGPQASDEIVATVNTLFLAQWDFK